MRISSRRFRAWAVCLSLGALLFPSPTKAVGFGDSLGLSPHWDWKTLETPNFRVTFPNELETIAQETAYYFEQAHVLLSPLFRWDPVQKTGAKTHVLVIDNIDAANALTAAPLRVGMVIMATPPDHFFNTTFYENWLQLVVLHEYTHFLNVDTFGSFWKVVRFLFGDVIRPNSLWHRWMLEGLAVYVETLTSKGGRGRSSHYEMILRSAVEAGVLGKSEYFTIDRVIDDPPVYPGGAAPYFFGFHLFNQISNDPEIAEGGESYDGRSDYKSPMDLFGQLSHRSGDRVPFFINSALIDLIGKDWLEIWDEWIQDSQERMSNQLQIIRTQPITRGNFVTENAFNIPGLAISPNGKWLAYTKEGPHRRSGLFLRNLKTGRTIRLEDKLLGSGMTFSKDSKQLFYSKLHRVRNFYTWSDLAVYDLRTGKSHWLTHSLRARDPSLSPDGRSLVFTITKNATTGIGTAEIVFEKGATRLENIKEVYRPPFLSRCSTPLYEASGNSIVFGFHPIDVSREDLVRLDLQTRRPQTLVSDGSYNRFPTLSPRGNLYYVSDRTGVNNLYRLGAQSKSRMITNVTTGLWGVRFSPKGEVWGTLFTHKGGQLARLRIPKKALNPASLKIPPLKVPETRRPPKIEKRKYETSEYSVIPSIWPRQWAPLLFLRPGGVYFGGQVSGFDSTDRHRYILLAAYDTLIGNPDYLALYSNRVLGPEINLTSSYLTTSSASSGSTLLAYRKKLRTSLDLLYPFRQTFSVITPFTGVQLERSFDFFETTGVEVAADRFVPSWDVGVQYSDVQASRLAISRERGRQSLVALRTYRDIDGPTFKGLVKTREHYPLLNHTILVGSLAASMSSRNSSYLDSNVVVQGKQPRLVDEIGRLSEQSLENLSIRGYPSSIFFVRSAAVGSLEVRFPLARIFRGWKTYPVFFRNLYGFFFGEASYFPGSQSESISNVTGRLLGGYGGGARLTSEIFLHVPITFSLEVHKGAQKQYGGKTEFIASALVSPLVF